MNIQEQVKIMEGQVNSPEANFTLYEKLQYLHNFFGKDPMFSKEARDIVIANISKALKLSEGGLCGKG
jgi:hypothetical protein